MIAALDKITARLINTDVGSCLKKEGSLSSPLSLSYLQHVPNGFTLKTKQINSIRLNKSSGEHDKDKTGESKL